MIDRNKLAEAARYADARSEEIGLEAFLSSLDIDLEGLAYVVMQRALRIALLHDGIPDDVMRRINATNEQTAVRLTPETNALMPAFGAAIMDGVAMMAAAFDIQRRREGAINGPDDTERELRRILQEAGTIREVLRENAEYDHADLVEAAMDALGAAISYDGANDAT